MYYIPTEELLVDVKELSLAVNSRTYNLQTLFIVVGCPVVTLFRRSETSKTYASRFIHVTKELARARGLIRRHLIYIHKAR